MLDHYFPQRARSDQRVSNIDVLDGQPVLIEQRLQLTRRYESRCLG